MIRTYFIFLLLIFYLCFVSLSLISFYVFSIVGVSVRACALFLCELMLHKHCNDTDTEFSSSTCSKPGVCCLASGYNS